MTKLLGQEIFQQPEMAVANSRDCSWSATSALSFPGEERRP